MARSRRRHQGRSSTSVAGCEVAIDCPSLGVQRRVRAPARLAAWSRPPDRLKPVLAERREVDQQVDSVGQSLCECLLRIEHRFVS
jgi:hypothetical protein